MNMKQNQIRPPSITGPCHAISPWKIDLTERPCFYAIRALSQ